MEGNIFVADAVDPPSKADLHSMEHPLFALKPTKQPFRYVHGDHIVEIRCGMSGRATMHDKDIWIFCISQLMAARNAGKSIARTVQFRSCDYLAKTKGRASGAEYRAISDALLRLKETSVLTNLSTGGRRETTAFGLIEAYRLIEEGNRTIAVEVTLPDWLYRAIADCKVLTLDNEYFQLRKPIERRLYELGRKHCGSKVKFVIGLQLLKLKVGSCSSIREFRRQIGEIERTGNPPEKKLT